MGTIKGNTTKTKGGIPSAAVRWWRVHGHHVLAAGRNSLLAKAAAEQYQNDYKRDFWTDFDTVKELEDHLKGLKNG